MPNTEYIQKNFNYMVVTAKGETYRSYKYDTIKRMLDQEGGRLYLYYYKGLKTVRLLAEWN